MQEKSRCKRGMYVYVFDNFISLCLKLIAGLYTNPQRFTFLSFNFEIWNHEYISDWNGLSYTMF